MRFYLKLLSLVLLLIVKAASQTASRIQVDLKDTRLPNGLRVITVEDHSAPVIAINVTYNVGSRDEQEGRTGFAHLFEHMMFQGSENVGKGEHVLLIQSNGGKVNGSTHKDFTEYHEKLPANQLDLVLFLESDRMRSLAVTQENLDNQRAVVQEEIRRSVDNGPYGRSNEIFQELIYDNFAYKHSTFGSMTDLNAATVDDVRQFFKKYYAPNNAVLTIVGDFKTANTLAMVKKYFENIPHQADPPRVDVTEPEQKDERRAFVDSALARVPLVLIAFKVPQGDAPDFSAMRLLINVLGDGTSSRLYQKLVKEQELVTTLFVEVSENRGPGDVKIGVLLRPGVKTDEVEAIIYQEIERLKKEPIADWELQKTKNAARLKFMNGLQNFLSQADTIASYAVLYGDPNLINMQLYKVSAVTKEDVTRIANKYLMKTNRTVVISVPQTSNRGTPPGLQ